MNTEKEINFAICAQAGQGLEKSQAILTQIVKRHNYYCVSTKDYLSRIRGGMNCASIRISEEEKNGYKKHIDVLFAFSPGAIEHVRERLNKNTLIFHDKSFKAENIEAYAVVEIDFIGLAEAAGSKAAMNSVAIGIIAGIMGFDSSIVESVILKNFHKEEIARINIEAVTKGREESGKWKVESGKLEHENNFPLSTFNFPFNNDEVKNKLLLTGNEALGLGCVAGGCDFISYYPMTPGAELYSFLHSLSSDLNIFTEQCEDEISVINMALGAWYSGGRGMITTSGGGFALMEETVSLAGMLESPVVIHIGQRPAPATGLPTRTEQADLNLALYAGHGEFPRIIFAPSTPEKAFEIGSIAFNLADKFQVPVFILSDEFFINTYFSSPVFDVEKVTYESHIAETAPDYKRYQFSDNGISPRGIPSYGSGLVCVDSDEHNENGEIDETPANRTAMVNKRLRKLDGIKKDILAPKFFGAQEYKTLLISWGSTYSTVKEVVAQLENVAMLHFAQVYPLSESIKDYIDSDKRVIAIENNATGQFANLIKLQTGINIEHRILKYDGFPFNVEDLTDSVKEIINAR